MLFLLSQKTPAHKGAPAARHAARPPASKKAAAQIQRQKPSERAIEEELPSSKEASAVLPKSQRGKIAIVLDDWGYNAENLELLGKIEVPLTLAILPFHEYSRTVAEFARRHNFHVIIHMPMEPKNKEYVGLEPRTLMTHMDKETMNSILEDAFDNIPHARGINNHMGSLATEDEAFMATVFQFLKKRNVFFLDSLVTPDSVCVRLAKEKRVKFARRSVFLDNSADQSYINNQLEELARLSDEHGAAIGIGHDRKATLEVLLEKIPAFKKRGYRFVFVSALVE